MKLLLACTGSIGSTKVVELVKAIKQKINDVTIKVVLTDCASYFVTEEHMRSLENEKVIVCKNQDEWANWKKTGDPIMHIELMKWADAMLIFPLDANTMAKLANGISDNLLTCICRAWNFDKPLFCTPAMTTEMWNHPVTKLQIDLLTSWKYKMVPSITNKTTCDVSGGEISELVGAILPQMK